MTVGVLLVAGLLSWVGGTLLVEAWSERHPGPTVDVEPPTAFWGPSIADEAQAWLDAFQP